MADQDFKINIVTLADLTGIKLTQEQLNALQTAASEGNKEAIDALKKLETAQKDAARAAQEENNEFIAGIRAAAGYGLLIGGSVAAAINKFAAEENKVTDELNKQSESLVKNVQEWNKLAQVATTPEQLATVGEKAVATIDSLKKAFNEANNQQLTFTQQLEDKLVPALLALVTGGVGGATKLAPNAQLQEELLKGLLQDQAIARERLRDITRTGLKEQQSAQENINAEILKETTNLQHQKDLLSRLDINSATESWIAQEKVVERITKRLDELIQKQKQLQQQGGPTTKAATLEDQLRQLNAIGARTDLTPKEASQVRDAQIATENALRDEQIKRAREVTDAQTQAVRDRYEKGFQALPGQAGLPQGQIQTNEALLEAIKYQNTRFDELLSLFR